MSKQEKPKAYIKPYYKDARLPNGNPFGVLRKKIIYDRNSIEYKEQTRMIVDVQKMKSYSTDATTIDI